MSVTLVSTPGASNANSFATEAQVASFMNERLNISPWTTISGSTLTDDERRALIMATRQLNLLPWVGTRVDETQALSWPRSYAPNPDAPNPVDPNDRYSIAYYDEDVIPDRIWKATAELALAFIKAGTTDLTAIPSTAGIKRKKVDVLETEYFDPYFQATGLARFPEVVNYITDLLDPSKTGGMDVVRV